MTQINDIADLVRVLQDNPKCQYALRGTMSSRDFSNNPGWVREMEKRLGSDIEVLHEMAVDSATAIAEVEQIREHAPTLQNLTMRIESEQYGPGLAADLELTLKRCLKPEDLAHMATQAGLTGTERRGFVQADLIIMAKRKRIDLDRSRYFAAESSHTERARDRSQAMTTAAIIAGAAKSPHQTAIISLRNEESADQESADSFIVWYQAEEQHLYTPELGTPELGGN